jgi:hypothetical protein
LKGERLRYECDVRIQHAVVDDRILRVSGGVENLEVRPRFQWAGGRDLKISVWGWGRLKQEIVRYHEVYKAFHPDATPISDKILSDLGEIKSLLNKQAAAAVLPDEPALKQMAGPVTPAQIAIDSQPQHDAIDRLLHAQIDTYRDFIRGSRPKTAIDLLTKLRDQVWDTASPRVRFRILANIGAAHHRLAQFDTAADFS